MAPEITPGVRSLWCTNEFATGSQEKKISDMAFLAEELGLDSSVAMDLTVRRFP
jgi:hypothetical protein